MDIKRTIVGRGEVDLSDPANEIVGFSQESRLGAKGQFVLDYTTGVITAESGCTYIPVLALGSGDEATIVGVAVVRERALTAEGKPLPLEGFVRASALREEHLTAEAWDRFGEDINRAHHVKQAIAAFSIVAAAASMIYASRKVND